MKFDILDKSLVPIKTLLIFTYSDLIDDDLNTPFSEQFNNGASNNFLKKMISNKEITGNQGEEVILHTNMIDNFSYKSLNFQEKLCPEKIMLYGLGKSTVLTADLVRSSSAMISRKVTKLNQSTLSVILGSVKNISPEIAISSITDGIILGAYKFNEFKSLQQKNHSLMNVEYLVDQNSNLQKLESSMKKSEILSNSSIKARDLVNRPPNIANPEYLKNYSKDLVKNNPNLSIEILDKDDMNKLEMRALLGVAQGSKADPYGIIIDFKGDENNPKNNIWLIGKGITFDSGGLSLKPSMSMIDMKSDMSGGAAVIAAMEAISKLSPKINVTGLCLATENMPGGGAQRVGDVVKSMNGKTIEIENTDAEGRLTLADAVEFANQRGAKRIIDVATLTGAMVIALGHGLIGAFSNDEDLLKTVISSGDKTGEKIWHMPLDETSKKQNRSKIADIKNTGGRAAGSVTAAHFIGEFVGSTPWVHLDIAGTAMSASEKGWISQGATGYPCRTLVETVIKLSY